MTRQTVKRISVIAVGGTLEIIALLFIGCAHSPEYVDPEYVLLGHYEDREIVGPAGPQGQAGPQGVQGQTESQGPLGFAVVDLQRAPGSSGQAGQRGLTGAPSDALVVAGTSGSVEAASPRGTQSAVGQTRAQGASSVGMVNLAGPERLQGNRGSTGLSDLTTIGPTFASGPVSIQVPRGSIREAAGSRTQTTVVTGGARGSAVVVADWTSFKAFQFSGKSAELSDYNLKQLSEVADYMKKHPSLEVGIDGFIDRRNQYLNDSRTDAVRYQLARAGIPYESIKIGAFGDANLRRDGRVEVLFRTAN